MVAKWNLETFVKSIDAWGLTEVFLPFLLIFTILFAVLEKTQILGTGKRNLNVVIALVISLSAVVPHVTNSYPAGTDVIEILNKALPQVSIVIVAILMLLIVIGVFGHEMVFLGLAMPGWVIFISVIVILVIFGGSAGWWGYGANNWLVNFFGEDIVSIVIMLLVFGIIIAFITSPTGEKKSAWEKLGFGFDKLFGGKKE